MCFALRMMPSEEDAIASKYQGNPSDCLRAVMTKWLQKGYNYQEHGSPTWRMLVKAVADPAGGDNVALAEKIARNHQGKVCAWMKIFETIQCDSLQILLWSLLFTVIMTGKEEAHSVSQTAAESIPQLDQSMGEDKTNCRELSATSVPEGGNLEKAEAKAATSCQGLCFLNLSKQNKN